MLLLPSRICSENHATSLSSSLQAFSPSVLLESKRCNHRIVLTWLQLGRISVLFYQWSDFYMVINLSIAVCILPMFLLTSFSVDEVLLLRYRIGQLISETCHLMRREHYLDLNTWIVFYLSSHRDRCLWLPAMWQRFGLSRYNCKKH